MRGRLFALIIAAIPGLILPERKVGQLAKVLERATSNDPEKGVILELTNHGAMKRDIIEALQLMSKWVTKNDTFLLSWSGQGKQVKDENGDEKDGYDEAFIAWDGFPVTDDELEIYLSNISAKGMCLIFDTSFSGGMADEEIKLNIKNSTKQEEILQEFTTDINKNNRVIIMSTLPNAENRYSYLNIFPLTWAMAFAFRHARDIDRDGWISAEEAFKLAKKIDLLVSIFPFVSRVTAIWISIYLVYKYIYNYDYPGIIATLKTIPFILGWITGEIIYYKIKGHFIINYPNMVDNYKGNLPIVEK